MLKIKIVDCDQISSKTNIKNDNPIFIHKLSRQGKMMDYVYQVMSEQKQKVI